MEYSTQLFFAWDLLDASDALCPSVDVRCDILIDALEGNTVVAEMRGRGEIEVVYVSSQAGSEPHGKSGLEVTYLMDRVK
jgi:hypothetical protein